MNKLSFEIKTSKDFFIKLKQDFEDFSNDIESSRFALNCAMTAWHLTDWVYHEFNYENTFAKLSEFQEYLKKQCDSLQIMQDICYGSKHYKLIRHVPKISETEMHEGTFDSTFDFSFDTSELEIKMEDGRTLLFIDEIEKTINFWENFLKRQNVRNINI
jgi:hypothetical protein